jgi:PDZ domain-containing protein
MVALRAAAGDPDDHGTGALVAGVVQDCPAFGPLAAGDVITAIDGEDLVDAQSASDAIDAVPPDEPIAMTVDRPADEEEQEGDEPGKPEEVSLTRKRCLADEGPILGVSMVNTFPFPVEINDKGIGGPSAGLMISLGLFDALTPGDLTAGRTVAGTGVIEPDGDVAPIGGVTKKVIGARAADADLFLVPDENLAEAKTEARGLKLVAVSSFVEAVEALGGKVPSDTVLSPSASPAAPGTPAPSPSPG